MKVLFRCMIIPYFSFFLKNNLLHFFTFKDFRFIVSLSVTEIGLTDFFFGVVIEGLV